METEGVKGTTWRMAFGFFVPVPLFFAFLAIWAAFDDGLGAGFGLFISSLIIWPYAYVFMGIQSIACSAVMEYWVNPKVSSSTVAIALGGVLGALSGWTISWFDYYPFIYLGAATGVIVGTVLRWHYNRLCRNSPLFQISLPYTAGTNRVYKISSIFQVSMPFEAVSVIGPLSGIAVSMFVLGGVLLPFSISTSGGTFFASGLAALSVCCGVIYLLYRFGIKAIFGGSVLDVLDRQNPFKHTPVRAYCLLVAFVVCSVAMSRLYKDYFSLVLANAHILSIGVCLGAFYLWFKSRGRI